MPTLRLFAFSLGIALGVMPPGEAAAAGDAARDQVWAAEVAFARTMADRDARAFAEFIADEAVFFAGTTALHGRAKVVEQTLGDRGAHLRRGHSRDQEQRRGYGAQGAQAATRQAVRR